MPATKPRQDIEQGSSVSPLSEEDVRHGVRDDGLYRRLAWGLGISLVANIVVWRIAAGIVHSRIITPPIPITIQRIVLPPKARRVPPKPRHVVKPPPKPIVKPIPKPVVKPITPPRHPQPQRRPTPHPPAAHNRVLVAPGPPAHSTEHTVLPGGNAGPGRPIEHQYNGNGADTNVKPPPAPPPPKPEPPAPPRPKPEPPPPPKPAPPPPPPPAGPTQDAQPANQVKPEIPDELRSETFKSHVRVKVDIHADGSFTPSLITSSGNAEIDQLVLQSLRQWKWTPALQAGKPVDSTQRFRFEFEVQ